uniref:NADH-ubiquinone oxidoreductase chain 2 n=1 Tax=Eurylepta cornuta TaxID=1879303 RepID=A0A2R3SK53_9PLAT|nr:NADH dehydrogenase subunit 2 [Eurylepta cornuta]
MLLGVLICVSSSNLFILWFGLELNMFGVIPFIVLNSNPNNQNKDLNVGIYYFIIQVIGSILFSWGSVVGSSSILGLSGLLIKMGVVPFFWWVPSVLSRVDWGSFLLLSTLQKIPSVLLIRISFDLSFNVCLFICLVGLVVSVIGINFSSGNFKLLLAWSSVGNMSLVVILATLYFNLGSLYFTCYAISVLGFILCISSPNSGDINNNENNGGVNSLINISFFLLIFSGLPPLLGFITKVVLFSGLSICESDMMIKQISVIDNNNYMVDYPIYNVIGSWSLSIVISFILILQIIAYIKVFISVYTSISINLQGSSRSTNSNYLEAMLVVGLLSTLPLVLL